jgi:hypothetical protein
MFEIIEIGSSPCDEPCAQIGDADYHVKARAECVAYKELLYRFLASKRRDRDTLNTHGCKFPSTYEKGWDLADLLQNEAPTLWDEQAKTELRL